MHFTKQTKSATAASRGRRKIMCSVKLVQHSSKGKAPKLTCREIEVYPQYFSLDFPNVRVTLHLALHSNVRLS